MAMLHHNAGLHAAAERWVRARCLVALGVFLIVTEAFAATPLRIMPLGDSLTAGNTDAPAWTIPHTFGYRGPLYSLLKKAGYKFEFVGTSGEPWCLPFGRDFGMPTVIEGIDLRKVNQDNHRGYGGANTGQILNGGPVSGATNQFPGVAKMLDADNPDIVLLMIGSNSAGAMDNIDPLVNAIVTAKPDARLIIAQIPPRTAYQPEVVKYNAYIKDTVVSKYQSLGKHVTTVDQYSIFLTDKNDPTSIDASLICPDGAHMRPAGNKLLATTWFKGIQLVADRHARVNKVARRSQRSTDSSTVTDAPRPLAQEQSASPETATFQVVSYAATEMDKVPLTTGNSLIRSGQDAAATTLASHSPDIKTPDVFGEGGTVGTLTDENLGTAISIPFTNAAFFKPGTTLTYNLNLDPATGGSAEGYQVTKFVSTTGWSSDGQRLAQRYQLFYATVDDPTEFLPALRVSTPFETVAGGWVQVTAPLSLDRVAAIQFVVGANAALEVGYRELQLFGTPQSAAPETVTKSAVARPLRIMPLGDSITTGYTMPDWSDDFSFSYRGALYTQLTKAGYRFQFVGRDDEEPWKGSPYGPPPKIIGPDLRNVQQDFHRGYGGTVIKDLRNGIVDWLKADEPDVVLLLIGINDMYHFGKTGNPVEVEARLKDLVQSIIDTKPEAHVIVAQIAPYKTGENTDSVSQYNSYIRNTLVPELVRQGKHVSTVDQYANFVTPKGEVDATMFSNIAHPNAVGYERMAQTWLKGIQAVVSKPEENPAGK